MAGEVAPGKLGQRGVAVDGRLRAEPVTHEDEAMLAPGHRPTHDQAALRRLEEEVAERMALGAARAPAVNALAQLRADVSGPSSASDFSISCMPRSAAAALTPDCRRRVSLLVRCNGVVSACSQG